MRHSRQVLPIVTLLLLLITGCKKEISSDGDTSLLQGPTVAKSATSNTSLQEKMVELRAKFPEIFSKQLKANYPAQINTPYRKQVLRVLKAIEPTACDDNTALFQWLSLQLTGWTSDDIIFAFNNYLLDLPVYYAWFYETDASSQFFGVNGAYTHAITKTFKDLRRFWNIETSDMMVSAMHGSMLADADKISATSQIILGLDKATADYFGGLISEVVKNNPVYRAGDHPLFSFNAFAAPTITDVPLVGTVTNKIIMGDGILDAYKVLGYGDVAPQAVLAHEFGHQIQYQKDLFKDQGTPEGTRRTELMADAYSAYYLSHARGAAMQWKRVKQFLQVFFEIGDCAFADPNHHGTPTQRMAAANWGYSLADNAQKQGHILTGEAFAALFDAQLSQIVSQ